MDAPPGRYRLDWIEFPAVARRRPTFVEGNSNTTHPGRRCRHDRLRPGQLHLSMGKANQPGSVETARLVRASGFALSYADPGFARRLHAPGHPRTNRHMELRSEPRSEPDSRI